MAKTPVSDILATIKAVNEMRGIVEKHVVALEKLVDSVERIEVRLGKLEGGSGEPKP